MNTTDQVLAHPLHRIIIAIAAEARGYSTTPGLAMRLHIPLAEAQRHLANNADLFISENGQPLRRIRLSPVGIQVNEAIQIVLATAADERGFSTTPRIAGQLKIALHVVTQYIDNNQAAFDIEPCIPFRRISLSAVGRAYLDSLQNIFRRRAPKPEEQPIITPQAAPPHTLLLSREQTAFCRAEQIGCGVLVFDPSATGDRARLELIACDRETALAAAGVAQGTHRATPAT